MIFEQAYSRLSFSSYAKDCLTTSQVPSVALDWDIFLAMAPGLSNGHHLQASFSGPSTVSILFCFVSESSNLSANFPSRIRTSGQN